MPIAICGPSLPERNFKIMQWQHTVGHAKFLIAGRRMPTFYHRQSDWFGWSCVILTLLLVIRQTFARRK